MTLNIPNEPKEMNSEFLHDAIALVNESYRYEKNYAQLAHIISVEFECQCKEEDISRYYGTIKQLPIKTEYSFI